MLGINWRRVTHLTLTCLVAAAFTLGLAGCQSKSLAAFSNRLQSVSSEQPTTSIQRSSTAAGIAEVSPPEVIQQLRPALEKYQPQVSIVSPQADKVLQDNTVSVQLQVEDLPLFKDSQLGMGPHLHVILDNQPYQAVYDLSQPLRFEDLSAGTHTLRVFASRPWHESFKNEGAYAQTTFHIFTKTLDQSPSPTLPLLTYSRPKGSYGAEPVMLDFYLTNAPLHLVAQENSNDNISDWQVRCTVNGASFTINQWQPIYLKGFKPGKNWVQLEFLDERGNPVQNVFNNTARLITYEPGGQDTLSKLVRGEFKAADARAIVDPHYIADAQEPSPSSLPKIPQASSQPTTPVAPEEPIETPEAASVSPAKVQEPPAAVSKESNPVVP